jgi:hypothetical protein
MEGTHENNRLQAAAHEWSVECLTFRPVHYVSDVLDLNKMENYFFENIPSHKRLNIVRPPSGRGCAAIGKVKIANQAEK